MNVNDMGLDELRLAVQTMRPYVDEVRRLQAELAGLRESIRAAVNASRSGNTVRLLKLEHTIQHGLGQKRLKAIMAARAALPTPGE